MKIFRLHLAFALGWALLSPGPRLGSMLLGYLVGLLFLAVFRRRLHCESYVLRTLALVRFGVLFSKEIIVSTFAIARSVLFQPIAEIDPDFVVLDVSDLRRAEIVLLSQCITLTPGTTSVEVSPDLERLTVHAFDANDPEAVRESIQKGLRDPILAFTRPWKLS